MTFVTIGLTVHDGFCRKPSADIPVRAHRVFSLGVQLTVSDPMSLTNLALGQCLVTARVQLLIFRQSVLIVV